MGLPDPLYALSGFAVGVLIGQTGVGGGSLMTPLLMLLFGIHPATAVGTDLLYAALTKSVGTAVHGVNRTVDWQIVRRLATGSVPATVLSIVLMSHFNLGAPGTGRIISLVLGCALIATAVAVLLRRWLLMAVGRAMARLGPGTRLWLTIGCGAALGVLVSISSVGAGAIGVTVLILLYPGTPIARIVGSDIAHAVPLTLIAGIGHWWLGSVDWGILGSLLTGSIPGIVIGSYLTRIMPERVIRPLLATVLGLVGGRLVF
jgi:uncharacterized membrane protein YfcA